jgi:hypothetical protein
MPALPFVKALLGWNGEVPNTADAGSPTSRAIAGQVLDLLQISEQVQHTPQTAGIALEDGVAEHLASALPKALQGREVDVSRKTLISDFEQYRHLATLQRLIDDDATATLRASIGTDYQIKPDVTVGLVDTTEETTYLHAAVPCKWTLRSDRAQNIRHEALTLIRNRRGRLPHVVAITAEPMPTRLASLARGTGEVDATYHVALDELSESVHALGNKKQMTVLAELVTHRRLRDVADLAGVLTI